MHCATTPLYKKCSTVYTFEQLITDKLIENAMHSFTQSCSFCLTLLLCWNFQIYMYMYVCIGTYIFQPKFSQFRIYAATVFGRQPLLWIRYSKLIKFPLSLVLFYIIFQFFVFSILFELLFKTYARSSHTLIDYAKMQMYLSVTAWQ